jgi:hypothetical protein
MREIFRSMMIGEPGNRSNLQMDQTMISFPGPVNQVARSPVVYLSDLPRFL